MVEQRDGCGFVVRPPDRQPQPTQISKEAEFLHCTAGHLLIQVRNHCYTMLAMGVGTDHAAIDRKALATNDTFRHTPAHHALEQCAKQIAVSVIFRVYSWKKSNGLAPRRPGPSRRTSDKRD